MISGTTTANVYALIASQLADPCRPLKRMTVARGDRAIVIIRETRARLDMGPILFESFITTCTQIAAVRYCFDFGCYRTEDPQKCMKQTSIS